MFDQIEGSFNQDPLFLKGVVYFSHELQKLIKGDELWNK